MGILAAAIGVEETRRRERETLRETNETLNAIISSAPLAVYDLDAKGNVRKVWNPAAEHIFGWSAKEALGQPLPFVSPEKQSEFSQILGRLLRGEQVNGLDVRRRKKDGSPIDVRLFAAPLRDVHGHIAGAMALVGDVTAQKRAEAALKESEERYKRLVEFSPDAVAVHSEGKFVFVNQAGVKMIGANSVDELIGKPILDIVHPDYKEIVKRRAFQKPGEEKEAPFLEEKFIRFDGTVIDVEVASVPITYQGKPAMQVVARDITNRKRVEEAFRNSESSYRGLFNSVSDAIYIQDKDGRFVDVNNGAVKMYGYPREFFVGKTPAVLAAPGLNDMQKTLNLVKKTFDGEPQRFEWWGKRKNGETFPKEIRLNRGTYFGQDVVIALAQDITERKRAEEQLRQSEEKYRTLFEESKDVIYISSVDGKILDINPAGVELFGFSSKDELLRVDIARDLYWNPDDRNNSQSILRQQGFLKDFEVELKTKGSDKLVCLESSTPMRNERGGIIGYRGVLRNITGRKQAEEELKKSELRFRRVWESTMDGMRIIDESGNIVMVNEAFCRMTGKSRGELEGKPYHTIYKTESPDEIERDMGLLRQRIASRTVQAHSEVETTLWDGRRVWLELSNSFLEIEEHRPTVLSIFRDITRRREAEEGLRKLSQAVEQSQVSVVITDVFGSIEYVNPKFTEITGYSKEEVLGTNPRILKSG
ncbi:MAG: PAS domain S-box protein, partial [Bacteroidota bacterium]